MFASGGGTFYPAGIDSSAGQFACRLSHVHLRRGGHVILDDIGWTVPAGACAAVLGPNGSGKSTIARILACHLWPSAGEVEVLGHRFGEANLPDLRRRVRLVQAAGPYDVDPALTAREVALTGYFSSLALYDHVDQAMVDEAERLLRLVGLGRILDHAYSTMSSGERVRCLIARALVVKPRLLLLDEPTAGLDLLAREQVLATVQRMFQEAPDRRPAVIVITHHIEELPPATSEILLLSQGRVAARGIPAEVLRGEVLSPVYGCPLEVRESGGRRYATVNPQAWDQLLSHDR